jgi:hypothetical protein
MWSRLLGSPHLGRVTGLEVHMASFGADGASLLASHPMCARLETLILRQCPIGKKAARALLERPIPIRGALELIDCAIGAPGLRAIAQNPHMRPARLAICTHDMSRDCASAAALLDAGPLLDVVTSLSLEGCLHETTARLPILPILDRCQPLRHLAIPILRAHPLAQLEALLSHPRLTALRSLSIIVRSAAELDLLLDAPFIPSLRALTLVTPRLTDADMYTLARAEALAHLERLILPTSLGHLSREARLALVTSPHVGAAVRATYSHALSGLL